MKYSKTIVLLLIVLFAINQGQSQVIKKKHLKGSWATIELALDQIRLDSMVRLDSMERIDVSWYTSTLGNYLLAKDTLLFFTCDIGNVLTENNVDAYFSLSLRSSGVAIPSYHIDPPLFLSIINYRWKIQKDLGKKYLLIKYSPRLGLGPLGKKEFRFEILSIRHKFIPESERFSGEYFCKELLLKNVTE